MDQIKYHQITLPDNKGTIGILTLSRPKQANAFSGEMMVSITKALKSAKEDASLRLLMLNAAGKHFSAGADLDWMKSSATLSLEENLDDAGKLTSMFEQLAKLPVPTIGIAKGAIYGGAVGLLASCDVVLGYESARFCLSEVKLGLMPGVILPYIMRKMSPSKIRRYGLSGKVFSCEEAFAAGLVDEVMTPGLEKQQVLKELGLHLATAPNATRKLKQLILDQEETLIPQSKKYQEAISKARIGAEGQNGLTSFFDKKSPDWLIKLQTAESQTLPFEGELLELIEPN